LGWDHPQTRVEYRGGAHASGSLSEDRRVASRDALAAALSSGANISAAFAAEISAPLPAASPTAATLRALEYELLLPLRAFNEDRKAGDSMTKTFHGRGRRTTPRRASEDGLLLVRVWASRPGEERSISAA